MQRPLVGTPRRAEPEPADVSADRYELETAAAYRQPSDPVEDVAVSDAAHVSANAAGKQQQQQQASSPLVSPRSAVASDRLSTTTIGSRRGAGRAGGRTANDADHDMPILGDSHTHGMAYIDDARTNRELCGLCGSRFHLLCNPRRQCSTCPVNCCDTCAPKATGSVRFCKVCLHEPRKEYHRLSAVVSRFPDDSAVWAAVAIEMRDEHSKVLVGGTVYNQAQCFARAIELDPGKKHWASLARALPPGGYADLHLAGKGIFRLSKVDCYANALYVRPSDPRIWTNLASDLTGSQTVEIEGVVFNKVSALLHSLDLCPDCAASWALLGAAIHDIPQKTDMFVRGRRYTILECFEHSLELEPTRASTWNNLASILPPTSYWISDVAERIRSAEECAGASFAVNRSRGPSMARHRAPTVGTLQRHTTTAEDKASSSHANPSSLHLHQTGTSFASGAEDTARTKYDDRHRRRALRSYVVVGGKKFFKVECAFRASELAPTDCRIRFNLATCVCPDHPISLPGCGRVATKEQLFRQVLEMATQIRTINMRCQLQMMFPGHPRLTALDALYGFDETKLRGRGAYGAVYEAYAKDCITDTTEETLVAKVVENFGVDEHVRTMLDSVDEIRALVDVRFSRNSVVQCRHIRVDVARDRLVLFLERAEGSLSDRLCGRVAVDPVRLTFRREPRAIDSNDSSFTYRMHEGEIRHSAARVLVALEEMHQFGAAHQDVKPDNVLLFADGGIKLGDLGSVAQVRGGKRRPGGTDPYLAPEALLEIADAAFLQSQRDQEVRHPSRVFRVTVKRDVWSWAALVVHLASGRLPVKTVPVKFNRESGGFAIDFSEGFDPLLPADAGVPHIPATLSRELRLLLRSCFCPNPADRPAVHEVVTNAYFTRSRLPADAEPVALFEHRKAKSHAFANGGTDSNAVDPEWALVYRDTMLYGAAASDAETLPSPQRPLADAGDPADLRRQASTTSFAGGGASRAGGPTNSRPLGAEILDRIRNIVDGSVDMTAAL